MFEKLDSCPVCGFKQHENFLIAQDHAHSKEPFNIVACKNCNFKFTNPRPLEEVIYNYYPEDNYISHKSTNIGIIGWVYRKARQYAIRKKYGIINKHKPRKGSILDFGCGTGEFLKYYQNRDWKIAGMEPSELARDAASTLTGIGIYQDLKAIKKAPDTYDVITLWHVLEHVHQIHKTIKTLKKKLNKKGILIVALPNCSSWDALHYKEHWAGYDVPRHLYHFEPKTFKLFAKGNDLKIKKIYPMKLDSYYVALLSEAYKSGKNQYWKALKNGWKSNKMSSGKIKRYSSNIFILSK